MKYKSETFEMRTMAIPHPAISLSTSIKILAEILGVLLILHWAWVTSYGDHAFAVLVLAVVSMFGVYKTLTN